jgi:hypothetical protein
MTDGCRTKAWIDADEENPDSRLDVIGEPFAIENVS